jgi:bifunctional non-homologous end joining protein LigD
VGAVTAKRAAPKKDALDTYRAKRDPHITPEPIPAAGPGRRRPSTTTGEPRRFVIQEHHASALHWDFRLERDGVLVSWAIPKGLPVDRKTNHLAVHTEDHPLEYATFEGTIPAGEYGGGKVILWDTGTYDEIKWSEREVMVVLHGTRVQGQYVLFATGSGGRGGARRGASSNDRNWMVHRMEDVSPDYESLPHEIQPMLAALGTLPKDDAAWAYEFKWDGIRAVGYVDGGRLQIRTRNGNDVTNSFPELRALGEQFGARQAVVDGEIVAFDDQGRPRFQRLQPRIHAADALKAKRLAAEQPVVYVLFDLLYLDGHGLVALPYLERRRRLEALGLEKPYLPGRRSPTWTKVKNVLMQDVIIGGWTPGSGHREGAFGSLLLGIPTDQGLEYVGQVGTGFSDAALKDLMSTLEALRTDASPFTTDVPRQYRTVATWVEPRLVGEVSFTEWTTDHRLRHPSWRGRRDDISPDQVRR